jgi:hypothetical protein
VCLGTDMKLGEKSNYYPRLSLGFKKYLLELNRTIDSIKGSIESNSNYGYVFGHSIWPSSESLRPVEIVILFLEDRRFFIHRGFEFRIVPRLAKRLLKGKRLGGISTIDQQVVRIITRKADRTLARKLREILLSVLINFHCPKRAIFDYYIHNAYMGHRLQGCEVAANFLFGKAASNLDWDEAGFVASLLPLPLPKAVYEWIAEQSRIETLSPAQIIAFGKEVAPSWAERIGLRCDYASAHYDFRPKSR